MRRQPLMRTVAIVQARMGSRRLPGKVLMPIAGKPLLAFLVDRIRAAASLDAIVVATGDVPANRPIVELAEAMGASVFLGSEEDVLGRFVEAAQAFQADVVVRVTADNPLTDPGVIDALVAARALAQADLVVPRDLIDGAGSEVTTLEALRRAQQVAATGAHREHVTLVMKERPDLFRVAHWDAPAALRRPDLSVTVDTLADLDRVRSVGERVEAGCPWSDVIPWLDARAPLSFR